MKVPGLKLQHQPRAWQCTSVEASWCPLCGTCTCLTVDLVEAGQTFAHDVPHAGSPDLTRFPMSGVERQLAHEIIGGVDRYVELLEVTGSTGRALGVLFIARGEAGAA